MDKLALEIATFGGGCFWGVEEAFRVTPGVLKTQPGYEGGHLDRPTYKDVCGDQTGHAEVVQVEFDASSVSYEALLEIFWSHHNPTQVNLGGLLLGCLHRWGLISGMEKILKQLHLTKAQDSKIKALQAETRSRMDAIRKSKAPEATKRTQMRSVFTSSRKKMMAILTPAQRTKFKQLMKAEREGHRPPPPNRKP